MDKDNRCAIYCFGANGRKRFYFPQKSGHLEPVKATSENQLVLLFCYARSGGTLFARCLANLPEVVLLSEVNPNLNARGSIRDQLNEWHGLQIAEGTYRDMAIGAHRACKQMEKDLVIRDFTFIDFTPHALNNGQPAGEFSALAALKDTLPLKAVAFVRNAFDVWISRGCPPKFATGYLNYVRALVEEEIPIFKYEEFCADPTGVLMAFCDQTGLRFHEEAIRRASTETRVTGDIDLKKPSRGSRMNAIAPLKRKRLPRFLLDRASNDALLQEANHLLGYSPNILDASFEMKPPQGYIEMKWLIQRILGIYPRDIF
jgi:hypothetical protein